MKLGTETASLTTTAVNPAISGTPVLLQFDEEAVLPGDPDYPAGLPTDYPGLVMRVVSTGLVYFA